MKERGILFTGEMVRAILDGRKTQTRRVIKPQPPEDVNYAHHNYGDGLQMYVDRPLGRVHIDDGIKRRCPYGRPGDMLWVKEKWGISYCDDLIDAPYDIWYSTGKNELKTPSLPLQNRMDWAARLNAEQLCPEDDGEPRWRSPYYMPKWASRLWLEVTRVRVERLQDISVEDIKAEGVYAGMQAAEESWKAAWTRDDAYQHIQDFKWLWDSINAKRGYGWDQNPWVWVISFKLDELLALERLGQ